MSSSRINRKIDTWNFRVDSKTVEFEIRLLRPNYISDASDDVSFKFRAALDIIKAKAAGVPVPSHGNSYVEGDTLADLRDKVIELCQALSDTKWKKVIVVGIQGVNPERSYREAEAVKFNYAVCYQAKNSPSWFSRDADTSSSWRAKKDAMLEGGFDTKEIFVYEYTPELEAALDRLESMLDGLVDSLKNLLMPNKIAEFQRMIAAQPQLLLTWSGEEKLPK